MTYIITHTLCGKEVHLQCFDGIALCGIDAVDPDVHKKPPVATNKKMAVTCRDCLAMIEIVREHLATKGDKK